MAITHRVSTAVFQTGTGNRTVAPDAATAVGELMVVPVGYQDSSATTISTPTGFTARKSMVQTGTLKTSVFTRDRQSGDSTFTYAPNQSVETSHLVLSVAGGDSSGLIVGADGTRAASGGTTATTAPSVTTTVANTRVYVIATERTTANETVEATVNNGFTKIVHAYANGTSAESIFVGYKDIVTPAAVGATTVTFQNSQASNGYAVLIAVPPAATVTYPRGFNNITEMAATKGATWAHRGGSASYPEHSLYAYQQAAARGYGALELSMQRTSDGVWFGCHDLTLARVTGNAALTQDVRTMTWAQVNSYQITIGAQGAPQPFMRWQDFIAAGFGNTHVLILDPKNSIDGNQTEFLNMVAADVSKDRVLMKWSGGLTTFATAAKAAGFHTAGYWYQTDYDNGNLAAQASSWDWLGMDLTATTAWTGPGNVVELAAAQGKKVWGHIAQSQADYNTAMSKRSDVVQSAAVASITAVGPFARDGSGALALSGSASRTVDVARSASGVLNPSGSVTRAVDSARPATGSLNLDGTASRSVDVARAAVGSLNLDGSAPRTIDANRNASGELTIDGVASATANLARTAAGSLALSGSGLLDNGGVTRTATGVLNLAGAASRAVDTSRSSAGELVITGTATRAVSIERAAIGALVLSGVGVLDREPVVLPDRLTLTEVAVDHTLIEISMKRTLEDA